MEKYEGSGGLAQGGLTKVAVHAGADAMITTRMPTPPERKALGMAVGVPVLSVKRSGRAEELYDADHAEIVIGQ